MLKYFPIKRWENVAHTMIRTDEENSQLGHETCNVYINHLQKNLTVMLLRPFPRQYDDR